MDNKDDSLESNTISALLSYSRVSQHSNVKDILPNFGPQLKTNFENRNLWLRFGLALTLSHESPRSALQAFNECMRIDQNDPLPAMLAARLVLEDLDDPDSGLSFADESIQRCLTDKCFHYKNIKPILSRCYLLASIMHAYIYEREPESIRQFKTSNLTASLKYLNLALNAYSDDYLLFFHKALHEAKQRSYSSAIDNVRQAIKLNPQHVPSMQLFILSLSALKLYDEALVLCQSALHEFQDDILLLYIKCNLEQRLDETKGFKLALDTAQHILKCIRKSKETKAIVSPSGTMNQPSDTKQSTNLFPEDKSNCNVSNHESLTGELSVWLLVAEIYIKMGSVSVYDREKISPLRDRPNRTNIFLLCLILSHRLSMPSYALMKVLQM